MNKPTQVEIWVAQKRRAADCKGDDREGVALSLRISWESLALLEQVAARLKRSKTGCAQGLLQEAVVEAALALELPELTVEELAAFRTERQTRRKRKGTDA